MILVILAIGILIMVASFMINNNDRSLSDVVTGVCLGMFIVGFVVALVSFIASIIFLVDVSNANSLDDKIAMYYEENAAIESQVDDIVNRYMEYESETFDINPDDSSNSSIIIASLYPELKSNTLVQSQIDIYVQNNEKIKELKERKIGASVTRWWLYFGK